ncbi:F-box only protein 16 [Pholidichthys leucotaenia]
MPHAMGSSANNAKMQTKLSAWTPLNHPLTNSKVFEERRSLLMKWFDRWCDRQRKVVLQDLVQSCSEEQLRSLSLSVSRRLPLQAADFTALLPRALCLYIFSFLDPRSLCRCAQVSWHWKSIVELEQLWMPKCLRLGWCLRVSPARTEQGVWKRHYIQTVQELRLSMQQQIATSLQQAVVPAAAAVSRIQEEEARESAIINEEPPMSAKVVSSSRRVSRREKLPAAPPPWRDSDRHPKDIIRFNYLDNLDPIQPLKAAKLRSCSSNVLKLDDKERKTLSEATYKLRRAKSLMFLSSDCRPHHSPPPHHHHDHPIRARLPTEEPQDNPITEETTKQLLHLARWNAGVRPRPVRTPVPRLSMEMLRASQRSHRSAPNIPVGFRYTTLRCSDLDGTAISETTKVVIKTQAPQLGDLEKRLANTV